MILKKNFLQVLVGRKKLHPAQMDEIKNSCIAVRKLFPYSNSFTKPHKTHKKIIASTYKQCITINISRNTMSFVFG